jgi:hypothetical protein
MSEIFNTEREPEKTTLHLKVEETKFNNLITP